MNPFEGADHPRINSTLFRRPKALLKLSYACNNGCLFCHASPHIGVESTQDEILAKIDAGVSSGVDTVVFSGGEPTIRKDFFQLARAVERAGMNLGLVTNGRMLAYPNFRKSLLSTHLSYIQVSLAGAVQSTHDAIVRVPGAFRQTLNGLRGLLLESQNGPLAITLNLVLTGRAAAELDEAAVLALALAEPVEKKLKTKTLGFRLKLSAVEPEGTALFHLHELDANPARVAPACREFFRTRAGQLATAGIEVGHEGFPLCLVDPRCVMDLWTDRFIYMSEAFEKSLHPIDDKHRKRLPSCHTCSLDDCPGFYLTSEQVYGPQKPHPVTCKKSNSFIFETKAVFETKDLFSSTKTTCPVVKNKIAKPDPYRELLTRGSEKTILWRTQTSDFGPRVIHRTKNEWEQIYLPDPNVRTETGDSFFHSLLKLQIAEMCKNCPSFDTCGKIFVPSCKNVIAEEECRINEMISGLKGLWLDLGCGSMPYGSAAKAGLSILGIDPEVYTSVSKTQPCAKRELLGWTGFRGVAEKLPFGDNTFSGVLAIRSIPHFPDPLKGAQEAFRVLRPGGELLLFSDVIFGICPNVDHATSADEKPYQHYRNPSPEELIDLLQNEGFETKEIRTPGPLTANLVFIRAKKPEVTESLAPQASLQ